MTIIISSISPELLVMTSDSAITTDFSSGDKEYSTKPKSFVFQGVGCITTWGESIHNKIGSYLQSQKLSAERHSVFDLVDLTNKYLIDEYKPHQDGLDDVGYHVGGFDSEGRVRMFHILWGFDRPKPNNQKEQEYKCCDHSDLLFLFNGRNDLAYSLIELVIEQLKHGVDVRYDPNNRADIVRFCDYVARFSAELTMEVGPPFDTNLIFPNNEIVTIRNDSFCPIILETDIIHRLNKQQSVLILDHSKSYEDSVAITLPTGTPIPEELLWGIFPE